MKLKLIAALTTAFGLSACSTIINGTNQGVNFTTGEAQGAKCLVTGGSKGDVNTSFTSPADLQIPRSKKSLQIECNKPGYQTTTKTVAGTLEGTVIGNVIVGGLPGLGVDAIAGSLYRYPDTIDIDMARNGISTPTVTGQPIT